MRLRIAVAVALTLVVSACTEPSGVIGSWQETVDPHRQLILMPDRTFIFSSASGEVFNSGTFAIDGNRITFTPRQFDDGTFDVVSRMLVLHYTTYPFDGPVPETMILARR